VVIVEATRGTHDKRVAALSLIQTSLRPAGYQREMFSGRKAQPLTPERITRLRAFLAEGMAQLDVPGVSVALLDGGRVVYEGGIGVRALGQPATVDADTLFMAASNTKAMTTLLLAQLVDQGKLKWDQPVIEVMPGFRVGNPDTTRKLLVKHLMCACTGLPRQDLDWLFDFQRATAATTMTRVGTLQTTSSFGEVYQYSNLMAAAAGYVGAAVIAPGRELGASYDAAMRERIFGPLGMQRTTFDFARAQRGNHARPHDHDLVSSLQALARMDINLSIVPVRPAGGVWTSARDLAKYVQMELAGGLTPDGRRLVSRENLLARAQPQVPVSEDVSYGMGLMLDRRYGIPVVRHGGAMTGYRSDMIWLPEHGAGAVILTNSNSGGLLLAPFLRRFLEILFDGEDEAGAMLAVGAEQLRINLAKERKEVTAPPDPEQSSRLADRYVSPALGGLVVRRTGADVLFRFSGWHSLAGTRRNEDGTRSFITLDPGVDGFVFVVGERDGRRALILRSAQHEHAFIEASK
jgi:CubicO group peptidase (beta-lactamase class C family)